MEAPVTTLTTNPLLTLTKFDRCDRCSAAAYVLVTVSDLPLQFCGHHYGTHQAVLATLEATVVVDNRADLLVKS